MKGGFIKPVASKPKKTVLLRDNDLRMFDKEPKKEDVLNKEYQKMQQFMLVSGQPQLNIMESKIVELDEKMNGHRNEMSLDDELELRKIMMKQSKVQKMISNYYENYLSYQIPRDPEQSVKTKLKTVSHQNKAEIQNLFNLHNKLNQSVFQDQENTQREFKFPQTVRYFPKKDVIRSEQTLNQSQQMIMDNSQMQDNQLQARFSRVNSQQIQNINDAQYQNEDDEIDDDDDDSSIDDVNNSNNDLDKNEKSPKSSKSHRSVRSNFDKVSRYSMSSRVSKGRNPNATGWEYDSLNEYDIEDIPKLLEKDKIEVATPILEPKTQEETKQEEAQKDGKKDKPNDKEKDKENEKIQKEDNNVMWKVSKKKILFIQQELSNDEFNKLNIHEKVRYVTDVDLQFYRGIYVLLINSLLNSIQKFSFAYGQAGTIHPENQIQYHRDLTSQARDMLSIDPEVRGDYYEQDRQALLEIEDIYIDMNNITFQDVTNIISERVSDYFIQNCIDPKYLAENYDKFSYFPEKSNTVLDKMQYTQSLQDVKKSQYLEMKSYYQKMKTWDNKDMQISHRDIIKETKTVTDWVLEDLFHIRKATMNSYDLDFDPKVNQIFQTQFYHKFEQKLLILLQIILYRQNIPSFKVQRDVFGKPLQNEEQQKAERLRIEKERTEQEKKFFKLFTSEEKLVEDLKDLLKNVGRISNQFIDGRSKVELLKVFLVDYNEIVKYKTEQLNRVKKIEEQINQINSEFSSIEGKTLYEKLFEAKIGHLKDQENNEVTDAQILDQLGQQRDKLMKERQSILLNSAQIFSIETENEKNNQNPNSKSTSPRDFSQDPNKNGNNLLTTKTRQMKNANRLVNTLSNQSVRNNKNSNKNEDNFNQSDQSEDLSIPLYKADSQYQPGMQSLTPQKDKQFSKRGNITTPNRNMKKESLLSPISTTKSRNVEDSRNDFNRQSYNKSSQKSLFNQQNQSRNSHYKNNNERGDSRLSNRQIEGDGSMIDDEQRDQLGMQMRRTPEMFHRHVNHSNTFAEFTDEDDGNQNQVKQIKLFKNARTQESEQRNLSLNKSRTVSQINSKNNDTNKQQARSKSPMLSNSKLLKQSYSQQFSDSDLSQTKLDRYKNQQMNNNSSIKYVHPFEQFDSQSYSFNESLQNEDTSLKIIQKNLNQILKESLVVNQNQAIKRQESFNHKTRSKSPLLASSKKLQPSVSQKYFQEYSNNQSIQHAPSKSPIKEVQSSLEMIINKNWKQVFKTASCRKNKNDKKF